MRKPVVFAATALLAFAVFAPAWAALGDYAGDWENADRNTRGITKLQIGVRGANVTVRAWGACTPQDCDWGTVQAVPYSSSVSEDMVRRTRAITAAFAPAHAQTVLVITQAGRDRLKVEAYTRFNSRGRNNYVQSYTMVRARTPAPSALAPVAPALPPSGQGAAPPVETAQPLPKAWQDCIAFDNRRAAVKQAQGRWKVAAGKVWLLDFGGNKAEAEQALRVIRQYRLNKQCFVGRPQPSMQYFLSGNAAPAGAMQGEDCNAFNLRNTQVQQIQGRWKIVDGSHWILDFGASRSEAQQAHAILQKHGFGRICFVGRPNPPMTYFRR